MKIPVGIINEFENFLDSVGNFGSSSLHCQLHDGRPRFVVKFEKSIIPGKTSSGQTSAHNAGIQPA